MDDWFSTSATFQPRYMSKHWNLPWCIEVFILFWNKGCQINWVIWRLTMTTIAYHYMHTSKMKKRGFIKNKVVKRIVKNNGEGDIDPTYPHIVPTNLWKWQCLDGIKPTPYQHDIQVTSIYWLCMSHMWVGICEAICASTKLLLFSHAPRFICKRMSYIIMPHDIYGFDHESMAPMFIDLWHILDDLDSSNEDEDDGIQGEEGVMTLVKSPPWMRASFLWMMLEDLMNQKVQMLQWRQH